LEELEGKVRKFEVLENINLEKLIDTLGKKESELLKLRDIEKKFNDKVDAVERRKDVEIREAKGRVLKEQTMKQDVMERLEALRMELGVLEKNEGSMAEIWKQKCRELVEISNKLKEENEELRGKMKVVLEGMAERSEMEATQSKFQLPKLLENYS